MHPPGGSGSSNQQFLPRVKCIREGWSGWAWAPKLATRYADFKIRKKLWFFVFYVFKSRWKMTNVTSYTFHKIVKIIIWSRSLLDDRIISGLWRCMCLGRKIFVFRRVLDIEAVLCLRWGMRSRGQSTQDFWGTSFFPLIFWTTCLLSFHYLELCCFDFVCSQISINTK